MQRVEQMAKDGQIDVTDWASLGSRILQLTDEAIRIQREEEGSSIRQGSVPFLRLVRVPEWEAGGQEACGRGSAA